MIEKKKIGITDTTLRDAHQSLLATRMRLEEMLPAAELMDRVGYHLEVWGGALTAPACVSGRRPWERLRRLRRVFCRLQMLRGQNIVGYRHYADDVVRNLSSRRSTAGSISSAFLMR